MNNREEIEARARITFNRGLHKSYSTSELIFLDNISIDRYGVNNFENH